MAIKQYKLKSGELRYQATFWKNKRNISSKVFKRKLDAREWIKAQEQRYNSFSANLVSISIGDFFDNIFWERKTIQDGTAQDYQRIFNKHVRSEFGRRRMADISSEEWRQHLFRIKAEGCSPARLNRIRQMISAVYGKAVKWGYCPDNPFARIESFKQEVSKFNYWNFQEVSQFLNWVEKNEPSRLAFYQLAYETGLRMSEIQGLQFDSLDEDNQILYISRRYCNQTKKLEQTTKSRKGRAVGLSDQLFSLIQSRKESASSNFIFSNEEGKPLGKDKIIWAFERDQRRAEVRRITFHSLRHTFASHFMMNGGNLYDLSQILGHSSVEVTKRYAHLSRDHLKEKANIVTFQSLRLASISQVFE